MWVNDEFTQDVPAWSTRSGLQTLHETPIYIPAFSSADLNLRHSCVLRRRLNTNTWVIFDPERPEDARQQQQGRDPSPASHLQHWQSRRRSEQKTSREDLFTLPWLEILQDTTRCKHLMLLLFIPTRLYFVTSDGLTLFCWQETGSSTETWRRRKAAIQRNLDVNWSQWRLVRCHVDNKQNNYFYII